MTADSNKTIKFNMKSFQVTDLKPAIYNPRKITAHDRTELSKSIDKFGSVEPIVVNINPERYGIIIGGHQRFNKYVADGITDIEVSCVLLSEDDEKELNLRLNRNGGEFDDGLLLANYSEDELLIAGFLPNEIPKIVDDQELDADTQHDEDGFSTAYTIIFDNEEQQQRFLTAIGKLKEQARAEEKEDSIAEIITGILYELS